MRIKIDVNGSDTIERVCKKIKADERIPTKGGEELELSFTGIIMDEIHNLFYYGVEHNSEIEASFFQIFVKTLTGKTISINAKLSQRYN